jgi:hypothetical protein
MLVLGLDGLVVGLIKLGAVFCSEGDGVYMGL